jgi:hypothetical protein
MNYAAVAVVIMLVSIVYEFTVMNWVIAASWPYPGSRPSRRLSGLARHLDVEE